MTDGHRHHHCLWCHSWWTNATWVRITTYPDHDCRCEQCGQIARWLWGQAP